MALNRRAATWFDGPFEAGCEVPCSDESETVLNNARFRQARSFVCDDGETRVFSWHTKINAQAWRIHFIADAATPARVGRLCRPPLADGARPDLNRKWKRTRHGAGPPYRVGYWRLLSWPCRDCRDWRRRDWRRRRGSPRRTDWPPRTDCRDWPRRRGWDNRDCSWPRTDWRRRNRDWTGRPAIPGRRPEPPVGSANAPAAVAIPIAAIVFLPNIDVSLLNSHHRDAGREAVPKLGCRGTALTSTIYRFLPRRANRVVSIACDAGGGERVPPPVNQPERRH